MTRAIMNIYLCTICNSCFVSNNIKLSLAYVFLDIGKTYDKLCPGSTVARTGFVNWGFVTARVTVKKLKAKLQWNRVNNSTKIYKYEVLSFKVWRKDLLEVKKKSIFFKGFSYKVFVTWNF